MTKNEAFEKWSYFLKLTNEQDMKLLKIAFEAGQQATICENLKLTELLFMCLKLGYIPKKVMNIPSFEEIDNPVYGQVKEVLGDRLSTNK